MQTKTEVTFTITPKPEHGNTYWAVHKVHRGVRTQVDNYATRELAVYDYPGAVVVE